MEIYTIVYNMYATFPTYLSVCTGTLASTPYHIFTKQILARKIERGRSKNK